MANPYQYYADTFRLYSPYLAMGWKWNNPWLNLGTPTNLYTVPYGVPYYQSDAEVITEEQPDETENLREQISLLKQTDSQMKQMLCIIIITILIVFGVLLYAK
jgi:hypothetical protein